MNNIQVLHFVYTFFISRGKKPKGQRSSASFPFLPEPTIGRSLSMGEASHWPTVHIKTVNCTPHICSNLDHILMCEQKSKYSFPTIGRSFSMGEASHWPTVHRKTLYAIPIFYYESVPSSSESCLSEIFFHGPPRESHFCPPGPPKIACDFRGTRLNCIQFWGDRMDSRGRAFCWRRKKIS